MGIDLLLVLGLQDQYDLDRHEVIRVIANRQDQLRTSINGKLCGILRNSPELRLCSDDGYSAYLKDMSDGIFSINLLLHDAVLIHTNSGQNIQDGFVHGLETIDN